LTRPGERSCSEERRKVQDGKRSEIKELKFMVGKYHFWDPSYGLIVLQ